MSWKRVINKEDFSWYVNTRKLKNTTPYSLHSCIFSIDEKSHDEFLRYLSSLMDISMGDSVAEFGCGNGSNLLHFSQWFRSEVFGIDISENLIGFCKDIFGSVNFSVGAGPTIPLPDKSVDHFISHSVFQYFPTKEFAFTVIDEMMRVARKSVVITDIKDKQFEGEFKNAQAVRQGLTLQELSEKYKDTPHLFFERSDFKTVVSMPQSYPDTEFNSFSTVIKLDKT